MLILARHCYRSNASAGKPRPTWMNKEDFFWNLCMGCRADDELIVVLDAAHKQGQKHFVHSGPDFCKTVEIEDGTESGAFCKTLDILQENIGKHDSVYIVEDDYAHRPHWRTVLEEGVKLNPVGFVTLYDHPDKYRDYPNLNSQILVTESCHWRTTPSTTNTYACTTESLMRNIDVHYQYSKGVQISRDHEKFLRLAELGQIVVSSIPGYSTHCDLGMISPFYD